MDPISTDVRILRFQSFANSLENVTPLENNRIIITIFPLKTFQLI